ncbi:MAG: pectinesterase family protein, partial [Candidatus Bathyarchaeota archaeon]
MQVKNRILTGFILSFLLLSLFTFAFYVLPVESETWSVDDDGPADFRSIQEAINNASSGDTIFVHNGTYYEKIIIDKRLTLRGENKEHTIINGSGFQYLGSLVMITADNATISSFTVTNARQGGIQVENSQFCDVNDNIVRFTGDRGIILGSGGNHRVYDNSVSNSSAYGGIDVIRSNNNTIYNNMVFSNVWGISINSGSHNEIFNNTLYANRDTGIHV